MSGFLQRLADRTIVAQPAVHALRSEPFIDTETGSPAPLSGEPSVADTSLLRSPAAGAAPLDSPAVPRPAVFESSTVAVPQKRSVSVGELASDDEPTSSAWRQSATARPRRQLVPLAPPISDTPAAAAESEPAPPRRSAGRTPPYARSPREPRGSVAAHSEARLPADAAPTEVHVHIGRIEVTAVKPAPAPRAATPAPQPQSLASYLDQRSERRS